MSINFGPTANLAVTDTPQLGLGAATGVFLQSTSSVTVAYGGIYTTVLSQSIGPYDSDVTVVCTATGGWQFVTGANPDSYLLSVGIGEFFGGSPANIVVARTAAGTSQPASSTNEGSFAQEQTYTLTRGSTNQFQLTAIGSWGQPVTSTYKIIEPVLKCEIIKR